MQRRVRFHAGVNARDRLDVSGPLYCGTTTVLPSQSVVVPFTGTLWVTGGELAGHYVVLSEEHYVHPGRVTEPPLESYAGLDVAAKSLSFGKKTGPADDAIRCDFVSWWEGSGLSIVGPITLAKVSG